jgi:hypothetical protein
MINSKMKIHIIPLALFAMLPALASAADVTMDTSDGFGTSSFNSDLNWDNNAAPNAGNAYFTGDFILRTPPDANDYTFGGDSLTINNTGAYPQGLFYKGLGTSNTTGTLTVSNLILNGGLISHGQGDSQMFNLAGNISVVADSTIWAKQGTINLYATISGSSNITVPIPDVDIASRVLIFHSTTSTFTGSLINNGRFTLADNAVFNFVIGEAGVNNSISGTGSLTSLNGDFILDVTAATTTLGDTWSIVTATGQTYGSTFSVAGFTDNLNDTWSKDINGTLSYLFNERTGTLSVVNPYMAWAAGKGLDGTIGKENEPTDDPDNDGATNLEEFAFNGNPLSSSDKGGIHVLTADTSNPGADKELVLSIAVLSGTPAFTGSPSPSSTISGITYAVEGSLDLSTFSAAVKIIDSITTDLPDLTGTGYEYRSFSLDGSAGLAGKGFLRAKVQLP